MHPASVGLIGGSGYSGVEATRLLASHPALALRFVASDQWQDRSLGQQLGIRGLPAELRYVSLASAEAFARQTTVTLLATPAPVSLELAPRLLAAGVRVIDLSGAFRLRDPERYPSHYDFSHTRPDLLQSALYGLPELGGQASPQTPLVANPGCYATAAALALAPLLTRQLVVTDGLIVDAASGVTGAGRKATEEMSFAEVDGDVRAYRVLGHQHTPEITQTLSELSDTAVDLVFTPHLLPLRRGILATAHARLRPNVVATDLAHAFQELYGSRSFIRVLPSAEAVSLRRVVHTARCDLGFTTDGRHVVVVAALDNLLKGAASQAVQNLNLMLGWPEEQGLTHLLETPA